MVSVVQDPPARLATQLLPSTNTVTVVVIDPLSGIHDAQQYMLDLCRAASGSLSDSEIQFVDVSHFACSRLVRVTFYDVRKAFECFKALELDSRFSVVLDLKAGTNRSVVVPKTLSVDVLIDKFSEFGDVEKIWIHQNEYIIDFFDARVPIRIVDHLNNHQTN
jgi:hypothetical protein